MTTHTPGPWIARECDGNDQLGEWDVTDEDGQVIASIRNPYVDWDMAVEHARSDYNRMPADAHLIAAAPELYEALQTLAGRLCGDSMSDQDRREAYGIAEAALRKAEGRPIDQPAEAAP